MEARRALALLLTLSLAVVAIALAQAAQASQVGRARAEAAVDVAVKACARVEGLVRAVNATAPAEPGVGERLMACLSALSRAKALVEEARERLRAGDYDGAVGLATQAMEAAREAFAKAHAIRERVQAQAVATEEARERAVGLLVAINRTIERVERLESVHGLNLSSVKAELERAREEIKGLVGEGKVSEAAHKLAQANQLVAQAFSELKSRAEEKLAERAAAFVEKVCEVQSELGKVIERAGLNATRLFEAAGLGDVGRLRERLRTEVRGPGDVKDLVGQLKEVGERLAEVRSMVAAIAPGPKVEAPRRVKVIDLINNAGSWAGRAVVVEGEYCGQRPPEGLPGPSGAPPKDSWVLADDTGWVYVVDRDALKPRRPILEGDRVEVVGALKAEAGVALYVEARTVMPIAPAPPLVPVPSPQEGLAPPRTGRAPPALPPSPTRALSIDIVERRWEGKFYVVKVKIANEGEDAIVFPNGAYGALIERKEDAGWATFYVPISIQILVELRPGEGRLVTLRLERPPEGTYRVVVSGWSKTVLRPFLAAVEFTVP